MRPRFEFSFHTIAGGDVVSDGVDASLALMGAQGWEIRGVAAIGGNVIVALQRPLDEEMPLPDGMTLAASLEEPLAVPELETSE